MRAAYDFNQGWLYLAEQVDATTPDGVFEPVTLPHSNVILPHQGFHDAAYQFVSTYRKRFTLPEPLHGRRLYLDFEGAMLAATVTINGHTFEEYRGGYTPFSFDITDYVDPGGENLLTVHLDSTERADIPPFGFVVDYLTFGGIYREVSLRYVELVHIENVRVRTHDVLSEQRHASVDVWVRNQGDTAREIVLCMESVEQSLHLDPHAITQTTLDLPAGDYELWTLDQPVLYTLETTLHAADEPLDRVRTRFGFREAVFKDDGFYLNGERLYLRGLNRHQTYPFIGAAAPARLQRRDAEIVKYELGCNLVRTSHYPQSKHFINHCDEIGLLVFEEIPGWQHIGDVDWQALSLRDVRGMIERDWNHPSVILWGVRINESFDDTEFYTQTNALAHELDPTRQTGGVRYFQQSEFLEDVFTYNDFSNSIEEPQNTPHLVTEFNGHMFPTKSFDNEERRVEHALRHARIQDRAMGMGGVSGAIGWCAFDYNTHKEFGSGDRICYHGVMDMFRLPKYAAHFYGSQVPPAEQIVLQAATVWSMGDRSVGGNDPLYIFSNCDTVRVHAGDEDIGLFEPARDEFPYLPQPPFKVTGLQMRWGDAFGDLRIIGYLDGEPVAEQRIACDGQAHALELHADDDTLHADSADMTRLTFRLVDVYGNRLPYLAQVVTFSIEGPGVLIGPNPFPLIGGQAAVFLKATHTPGTVTVRAQVPGLAVAEVQVTLSLART